MVDRDLGGAFVGVASVSQADRDAAHRWLVANGHDDLLEILGLVTGSHLCPTCGKRPWLDARGMLCQRKECRAARKAIDASSDAGPD